MKFNPLALLDMLLADWASPKVRRLIHGLLTLALGLVALWLAMEGDWQEFLLALVAAVYAGANKANTPVSGNEDEPLFNDDVYEEYGGDGFEGH